MSDQGPTDPPSTDPSTDPSSAGGWGRNSRPQGGGLRIAGRLSSTVTHTLEQRLALLDEIDTLAERRSDLVRSAQLLGGRDSGERPTVPAAGDSRHRLTAAFSTITSMERAFDQLERTASEARR